MRRKKKISLEVVNPHACGIDVGSRSHFVAIGQNLKDVKEFGVYQENLEDLGKWLLKNGVDTAAMESTGDYWQNLHAELERIGIEVILTNGKFTKNIKGKKTDVLDCMWIQKLHSLGLLSGSFLPDDLAMEIRAYTRQRKNILHQCAKYSKKMQKNLKLLNFRLDVAVSDVCGKTGIQIIRAICEGELNPKKLAKLRNYRIRKSEEEIAKALNGNNRREYLFCLNQDFNSYNFFRDQLIECDLEIEKFLEGYFQSLDFPVDDMPAKKPYKRKNKNSPKNLDMNIVAYQYFGGVDLMAIEGVSEGTLLALMGEIGPNGIHKFKTGKQFTSWLRLAPNNKISGGKTLSNRTPKGSGRLKIALRNAANAIGNLKEGSLALFFRRISHRKGRQVAITATARKLAMIIWNMLVNKTEYKPAQGHMFLDEKRKLGLVKRMRKSISKFELKPEDLGFAID